MADPQQQDNAVPAQPEQGPVPHPAVQPPSQPTAPSPAPSPSGLDAYSLTDTQIEVPEQPQRATPLKDPATGRFVRSNAAPSPAPEPPQAELPAASQQHSHYLISLAKDMGFSDEEIAQSPREQLEREVYRINRRLRADRTQDARVDAVEGRPAAAPVVSQAPPTPEPSQWFDESFEVDDLEKPGIKYKAPLKDILHPALIHVIDQLAKRVQGVESGVGSLHQHEQSRQAERFYTEIDKLFVSRPDLFGAKTASQMKPEEPHFQKRGAIVALMKTFKDGNMHERWEKAVKMVYGDTPAAPAPLKPAPTPEANGHSRISPETWSSAGLAAPTNRNGASEPVGIDKAAKGLAAKLRELEAVEDEAADKDFKP